MVLYLKKLKEKRENEIPRALSELPAGNSEWARGISFFMFMFMFMFMF